MRRVVLMMSVSIDGFVAGPHGHAGALPEPDELKRWKLDRVRRAGTHIMGRVTYEEMAGYWPTSTDDYAAPMNEIPKVVFSRTLERADWPETRIARGDLSEEIGSLKREAGNDLIAYGGATLDQALTRLGLVDEYRLMIQPAALGAGLPLFKDLRAPPRSHSRGPKRRAPACSRARPLQSGRTLRSPRRRSGARSFARPPPTS